MFAAKFLLNVKLAVPVVFISIEPVAVKPAVISDINATVPDALGNNIDLSAVGSTVVNTVS